MHVNGGRNVRHGLVASGTKDDHEHISSLPQLTSTTGSCSKNAEVGFSRTCQSPWSISSGN